MSEHNPPCEREDPTDDCLSHGVSEDRACDPCRERGWRRPVDSPTLRPYYSDEQVTLYLGDCLSVLPDACPEPAALVMDPPYGIDYQTGYSTSWRSIAGDKDTALRDAILTMYDGTPAAVFGAWRAAWPVGFTALLVYDRGEQGMGDLSIPWRPSHDPIFIMGKGWAGKRTRGVLREGTPFQGNRLHPHEKCIHVLGEIIRKAPAGTILDPFAGSGSTLLAAAREGRKAVGIEVDERWAEVAAKRLANRSDTLFGGVA